MDGKLSWLAPAIPNSPGWPSDLGAPSALDQLYLWNIRYQGGIAGTATYNLYYADSPTVALPPRPKPGAYSVTGLTPQGDYDFSSGGWTKFNTSGALSAPKAGNSIVTSAGSPPVTSRWRSLPTTATPTKAAGLVSLKPPSPGPPRLRAAMPTGPVVRPPTSTPTATVWKTAWPGRWARPTRMPTQSASCPPSTTPPTRPTSSSPSTGVTRPTTTEHRHHGGIRQ